MQGRFIEETMNLVERPGIWLSILSFFAFSCSVANAGMSPDEVNRANRYLYGALGGDSTAQYNLGLCYERGIGVAVNKSEAVKWYQKSADQGDADGLSSLACCYYYGIGVLEDKVEAYAYFSLASRSMEKAKKAQSELAAELTFEMLTKALSRARDLSRGIEARRAAKTVGTSRVFNENKAKADAGDAPAQSKIGYCYYKGEGVARDYEQAVYWFRKSADQGYPVAQHNLGYCYFAGEGVSRDYAQALFWFRRAADSGNHKSGTNIAHIYFEGLGVAKDYVQGLFWLHKAAKHGNPEAQFALGKRYEEGDGVGQDKVEAYAYYNIILANKEASDTSLPEDARARISSLEKTMSKWLLRDDIAAGQKRTKELQNEIEANISAKSAGK